MGTYSDRTLILQSLVLSGYALQTGVVRCVKVASLCGSCAREDEQWAVAPVKKVRTKSLSPETE